MMRPCEARRTLHLDMSIPSRPDPSNDSPPFAVGHAPYADREEWSRHVEGMAVLAGLVEGRRGEEGMRRHYLALMKLCAVSMGEMLQPAGPLLTALPAAPLPPQRLHPA